jgi:putative endonuclease
VDERLSHADSLTADFSSAALRVRRSCCASGLVPIESRPVLAEVGAGAGIASTCEMAIPKRIVYVLKSDADPVGYYTGLTSDMAARLTAHNTGRCPHTAPGRPWTIDVIVEFADERRAVAFEQYLKSGSGFAFARRHLR